MRSQSFPSYYYTTEFQREQKEKYDKEYTEILQNSKDSNERAIFMAIFPIEMQFVN